MEFDEFDALDAGIEPGGLRSRFDIRILVCYLVSSLDSPISRAQIGEIAIEQGLANYFEVNQALTQLLENGSLTSEFADGDEFIEATAVGRESAKTLETHIPRVVREKAINAAIKLLTRAKNERENRIEVKKLDGGGYHVTFSIADKELDLMRLTVFVADEMQVETVRSNFLDDPVKLYSAIIATLTV